MSQTVSLTKVLHVRENEKKVAQKAFLNSQEAFEKVATKLYNLLKKKEIAEASYDEFIQSMTPLERIKEQIAYIEKLNDAIIQLQREVQFARKQMEQKQQSLTAAYIEVKKFESIIEKRKQQEVERTAKLEKAFMDEISINQFLSNQNR
ncbi:flagellar export protein FliJ [Oceanobacillus alkalisoli]|uniref:flagellar export protein FliJ n=1 Tax=Oceanobacillus alkalisoli TaxID=2925113 RepID=UPI001EF0AB83|nr:flagellar export protein FliJ [Oceanobacillus alkalisoli]MCF3942432.1 flagellar export protein FliJ [Oceanobacillus alkalisoli]MCG5103489.1 flagellar export protein FliJ [Oceanobacillus alkalisoli]